MRCRYFAAFISLLSFCHALADAPVVIESVTLKKADVFDLSDPDEDNWLFRAANRLHINTRDKTIHKQLLFAPGDQYDKRLAEESERLLRQNRYLYDANITATPNPSGNVDLVVETRDVWSLEPELSLSRSGGETRSGFGLEESNLLGRGQMLRILREDDIDRSSNIIEFKDRNLAYSWVSLQALYADSSDGDSSLLRIVRPFYALDTRWAAGGWVRADDRRSTLYANGEVAAEYQHENNYATLFGGWSQGLQDGKVQRWTAGMVYDENEFAPVADPTLPAAIPDNRKLVYPFVGFELVEDGYVTTQNSDQISRTEDFQMGMSVRASLGWSDTAFGADRDAAIFSANASRGFGSMDKKAILLSANTQGRVESGDLANTTLSMKARYYRKMGDKHTFFATISGTVGSALDLDNPVELGGKTGMRGYPLRYQAGESKMVATIEHRYFTDWYPFRLARVGGAIFADAGKVWGENPLGEDNRGWISNIGLGLRLALTRVSSGRVVHIDLAFPLNGDPTIDDVQFLIESRRSF